MRDPQDEEPGRPPSQEEEQGTPAPDGAAADQELALGRGRPALNDEIARRWSPQQLLRTVSRGAGRGDPLDATTRARFERRFGVDLGGVRVYTGDFAEKVTARHGAEAITVGGTGMIFMSGSPDRSPATSAGRALLAHELTHVAQSARGIYRSAPGERPPLATEAHEAEAEAVEAQEALFAGGGGSDSTGPDPEKAHDELLEVVSVRVLDLIYDDERIHALRNGDPRRRP